MTSEAMYSAAHQIHNLIEPGCEFDRVERCQTFRLIHQTLSKAWQLDLITWGTPMTDHRTVLDWNGNRHEKEREWTPTNSEQPSSPSTGPSPTSSDPSAPAATATSATAGRTSSPQPGPATPPGSAEPSSSQANAEAPKQAAASLPVLPCGCVPPCEGHHEDES